MDEKTMSVQELRDKCEKEAYLELGKIGFDDDNRKPLLNEVETYAKIRRTDEIVEQQRINANIKNELDARKVAIAEERAQLEKQKIRVEYVKAGLFTTASFLMGFGSHFIDEWFAPDRTLGRAKETFLNLIIKK